MANTIDQAAMQFNLKACVWLSLSNGGASVVCARVSRTLYSQHEDSMTLAEPFNSATSQTL